MARKTSVRVVMNRKALTAIRSGVVDGMEALGQAVLSAGVGKVPDDPETQAIIEGGFGIWADGKKVAGTAQKPRSVRVKSGVTLICGYGFPARFQSLGTIHIPPNPGWFVTPVMTDAPGAERFLKPAVRKRLAGVR